MSWTATSCRIYYTGAQHLALAQNGLGHVEIALSNNVPQLDLNIEEIIPAHNMSNLERDKDTTSFMTCDAQYLDILAKRVILRLRVNEFEGKGYSWEDHVDAIQAYLRWAGLQLSEVEEESATKGYFAHVEPFQAPEVNQKTFHVIVDIQQQALDHVDFDDLLHEVYRVRRKLDGDL